MYGRREGASILCISRFISIKIVYSPFANWIDDLTVDGIAYPDCITRGSQWYTVGHRGRLRPCLAAQRMHNIFKHQEMRYSS